ncbi:nuclear transport factor 2 family protein [Mycobacterium sp. pUA109]|uniref:nuclear transport factor 2 family protein n=1 Tax=Mycobacterium sp. pUA109 TaxID=3238982 RepID=UPI00351B1713
MDDVAKLLAIQSIRNSKARYGRGADTQDWDVFASSFTEDALWDERGWAIARFQGTGEWNSVGCEVDYSVLEEMSTIQPWPIRGRAAIQESGRDVTNGVATFHQMLNPEIEFLTDTCASVVWPFQDTLHFPKGSPIECFDGLGRYIETYAPEGDEWRIKTCRVLRFIATVKGPIDE